MTNYKKNSTLLSLVIPLLSFLLHLPATTAATPPTSPPPSSTAPAPSPSSPPPNITQILQKADEFSRFLGLLKSTHVGDRLETQLDPTKNNNQLQAGLTIFAPNDNAFSGLKSGSINSLSYDQVAKLVLFHCVPSFLSFSALQTAVSPIRTEAGDVGAGQFPLNVTVFGTQVNFSTGVSRDHASVSSTIYSNSTQGLAIYEVDQLLAPKAVFPVSPFLDGADPAPAPAPALGPASAPKSRNKDGDNDGVVPAPDGAGPKGGSVGDAGKSGGGVGSSTSVRASTSGCGGGGSATMLYYYYSLVFGFWVMAVCS